MSRYNHLLSRCYKLLLLECSRWDLSDLACTVRSPLVCGWWCRQGRILLRSFSRNESYVLKLNPLHDCASICFANSHTSSRRHGVMLSCRIRLNRSCGLRRVWRVDWSPELDHFLCYDLSRIISTHGRLIIAWNLYFWRVSNRLALTSSAALYPLCIEHRTWSLLLRIFNLIRVWRCHHVRSLWALCLLLNYTICF
jgi:hypothetical protein